MNEELKQQLQQLPQNVQTYLKEGTWSDNIKGVLTKNNINPNNSEKILFEFLLHIIILQNRHDLVEHIKDITRLPATQVISLVNQAISTIPPEINSFIKDAYNTIEEDDKTEKEATQNPVDESIGGVEITQNQTPETTKEEAPINRDDVIAGIENPNNIQNPISSKLQTPTSSKTKEYASGQDPYREPIE
tara:strand:- start:278 stop:847 length:570 start_codon:yes stop_codon:yes gene_type:complete